MLTRRLTTRLNDLLNDSPAVVVLGPRPVGKTTVALEVAKSRPSIYLDLENEEDRAKLSNPTRYFADHERELVILDEVHRVPELFQSLRASSTAADSGARMAFSTSFTRRSARLAN